MFGLPRDIASSGMFGLDGAGPKSAPQAPITFTQSPVTTVGSVLGIVFDGGVLMSSDMVASYGSMARYLDCPRLMKVNDGVILGAAGDYADFQFLKDIIEQRMIDDRVYDDNFQMKPNSLLTYLTRILYNRRSKFDPLWNNFIVAGVQDGKPFLGTVDKIGTCYYDGQIATSMGTHLALPLLRERAEKYGPKMTEKQAREALLDAMRTLYYRDGRAYPRIQIAKVTADGVEIEAPTQITSNWEIGFMVEGY